MIATVSLTDGTTYPCALALRGGYAQHGRDHQGWARPLATSLKRGLAAIQEYEQQLMHYALQELASVPELTLYGPADRLGVIAFNLGKHHAYDVGSFLDNYGVAVRTGHHCAMPLMAYYQVPAMCRASLVMYNTTEEVDRLVAGLKRIHQPAWLTERREMADLPDRDKLLRNFGRCANWGREIPLYYRAGSAPAAAQRRGA